MKLTRYTDYSLRVLIYLGLNQDRLCTIGEISNNFHISENHLMKVAHQLVRMQYLQSVRGRKGGFKLARATSQINVGDVIRHTETNLTIAKCFNDPSVLACPISRNCALKVGLGRALNAFFEVLDEYTLSDLIENRDLLLGDLGLCTPVLEHA